MNKQAITDEALTVHIRKSFQKLRKIGELRKKGLLTEEEVAGEVLEILQQDFYGFLSEKGLRLRLNRSERNSWLRFTDDYCLWKSGKQPCSKRGSIWLVCQEDGKKEIAASAFDKAQFFRLMGEYQLPLGYFEPLPDGAACPDDHAGYLPSDLIVGWRIWTDDGGLHTEDFPLGDILILTDHYGLKSRIRITEHPANGQDKSRRKIDADYIGTGTMEGYTTSREREIRIHLENGAIHSLFSTWDNDDRAEYDRFPLWQESRDHLNAFLRIQEKVVMDLIESVSGKACPDEDKAFPGDEFLRDHIAACLYGGALGDALGYEVEFETWRSIQSRFGAAGIRKPVRNGGKARVSDDTQMTLFTAEGMGLGFFRGKEKGAGAAVNEDIYQAYLVWLETQGIAAKSRWDPVSRLKTVPEMHHRRAPGNTCLSALGSGEMGTIEKPINRSKGCGGVMRTAPLGFVRCRSSRRNPFGTALRTGAEAAAITHGHPLGWLPAGMLADIVDRCLYEDYVSLEEIVEASLVNMVRTYTAYREAGELEKLIRRAMELAKRPREAESETAEADEAAIRSLGEGWVGDEALAIAVYAALRHTQDLPKALQAAVNHSGDSDSTGAIAGNILGAFLGMEAIPEDWMKDLELREEIEGLADMMIRIIRSE